MLLSNVGLTENMAFIQSTFTPHLVLVIVTSVLLTCIVLMFYDRIVLWSLVFERIDVCSRYLEDKYDQIRFIAPTVPVKCI